MRILVSPDSFKGSESAKSIGEIISSAIKTEIPHAIIDVTPMADGGEGTIDALLHATKGKKLALTVTGPLGGKIKTHYGLLEESQTAVIEVASFVGFTAVSEERRNPLRYTTLGIGECIENALEAGYRKFIFCLGGSATNDGGFGMLLGIGVSFKDRHGTRLEPYPHNLSKIHDVDYSGVDPRIWDTEIRIASDVKNPLCGKSGATYIFGPQKGVKSTDLAVMDQTLKDYADKIECHLGKQFSDIPGAGAAGGLGFALLTIGAKMESGAELIANSINLEAKILNSDWVITGEGRTDHQTLQGKLPYVIAKMARRHKKPTILISGSIESNLYDLYEVFESMHAIANGPLTLKESIEHTQELLYHRVRNIARLLKYTDLEGMGRNSKVIKPAK
ncbi:glycerate kinase [Sporosarcina cascadiensis]|uniref:glycerate kinase n=1 Tax=Sporosarcina cascadiensis TaxID=2660747 RepID=UPI00129A379C|nr:glycerate kinase [Sporosarcina cascadiensis]